MEVEDTEENQDPLPSTSEQGTSLNINFIKLEPVFQSETVDKPHPVIIKSEPPVKFESVKSEPTYSSDDEVLEEVEPQYVDQTDIKEEFTVVEEESVDLDDDVKEEIEIDAVDGSTQGSSLSKTATSTQTNKKPKRYRKNRSILRNKPCPYCDKLFRRKIEVDSHIISYHKCQLKDSTLILTSKVHKCAQCNYETVNNISFKRHLMVKHTNTIICMFCSECFDTKQNLDSHLLDQHANILGDDLNKTTFLLHTCNLCIYETVRSEDYQRHLSYHEQNPGFKCETCGYECWGRTKFRSHLQSHFGANLFRCIFCHKDYFRLLSYRSHLLTIHKHLVENLSEIMTHKMHKCTECSYETVALCSFKRHLLTHRQRLPAKEHLCGECDFKTVHRRSLQRHMSIYHSVVKRFVCSACSEGFHYKTLLDAHILEAHSDNQELRGTITRKFYECDTCSFKSLFSGHLVKHKSSEHGMV